MVLGGRNQLKQLFNLLLKIYRRLLIEVYMQLEYFLIERKHVIS
jgi:hypothetical protein